jgi:hypothetical protein
MQPINVQDLTLAQIAEVEKEVGVALDKWPVLPSRAELVITIAKVVTGEDISGMRLRDVNALITFTDEDDDPNP